MFSKPPPLLNKSDKYLEQNLHTGWPVLVDLLFCGPVSLMTLNYDVVLRVRKYCFLLVATYNICIGFSITLINPQTTSLYSIPILIDLMFYCFVQWLKHAWTQDLMNMIMAQIKYRGLDGYVSQMIHFLETQKNNPNLRCQLNRALASKEWNLS